MHKNLRLAYCLGLILYNYTINFLISNNLPFSESYFDNNIATLIFKLCFSLVSVYLKCDFMRADYNDLLLFQFILTIPVSFIVFRTFINGIIDSVRFIYCKVVSSILCSLFLFISFLLE